MFEEMSNSELVHAENEYDDFEREILLPYQLSTQGPKLAKADIDATVLTAEVSLRRSEDVRRIWPFLRDRRIDSYNEITTRFID